MTKQIPGQMSLFNIIEPSKACGTCDHFFRYVCGLGEIYHGTACGKNRPWSVDKLPEDSACEQYQKRDDNNGLQ